MKFEEIDYMKWAKTHPPAECDLTRSSVDSLALSDLEIDFGELELTVGTGYGFPPLIDALSRIFAVGSERVALTLGTSHALYLACAALLSPGDEVLVEQPAYQPLRMVPAAFGARVIRFERPFERGYGVRLSEFEKALSSRTRLVILTNLHNPSGSALTAAEISGMADLAGRVGADLLVDEVYLDFMDRPGDWTSAGLRENLIVVSSLTKVYGMGGLRCGWMIARPDFVEQVRMISDHMHVEGVHIGEQIALRAVERLPELRRRHRARISRNRALIRDFVSNDPFLSWVEPDGGVVCFPRIEHGPDAVELADLLRDEFDTGIVPGGFFEDPRHFRIGFGGDGNILAKGLERIGRALAKLGT